MMAEAASVGNEIPDRFYDRLRERMLRKISDKDANGMGCWEWSGAKKGGSNYGVVHLRIGIDRMVVHAHRASYIAFNRRFLLAYDISHCCHHSSCINPDHLSHEPHTINMDRERCRKAKTCSGHIGINGEALKQCLFRKADKEE